jgi:DNA repair exonuclease SbcCD ATPase subunit
MNVIIISICAGLSVGILFFLISIFSKKKDYMLPDYTEEDAPDNVRIIEKEVFNTDKIDELNDNIKKLESENTELRNNNNLLSKDNEKVISEKDSLKSNLSEFKEKINILENNKNDLLKSINGEKEVNKLLEENIKEIQDKLKNTINEKEQLITDLKEKENTINKDKIERNKKNKELIKERDYFINIVEEKDKTIKKLKQQIQNKENRIEKLASMLEEYQKTIEGKDDIGHYYDIDNLPDHFNNDLKSKINNIYDNLDSDKFAYYTMNNFNGKSDLMILDKEQLPKYVNIAKRPKTRGKTDIILIVDNKVYKFTIN